MSFQSDLSKVLVFNKTLEVNFPDTWKEKETSKKGSFFVATYLRSTNDSIPSTGVYSIKLQPAGGQDIKTFSTRQLEPEKKRKDFVIEKVIVRSDGVLPFNYGIGYWCTYTDEVNGKTMKVFYAHAIHQNNAASILMKIAQEDFSKVETEWVNIIKSHRFIEVP
jgi:hypothetical protein